MFQLTRNTDAAIARLQSQQRLIIIALVVLAALFVLVNGGQLVRWLRRHDRLSCGWLKKTLCSTRSRAGDKSGANNNGPTAAAASLTHANPHTQSPRLQQRAPAATANLTLGGLEAGAGGAAMQRIAALQRQASTAVLSDDGKDVCGRVGFWTTEALRANARSTYRA